MTKIQNPQTSAKQLKKSLIRNSSVVGLSNSRTLTNKNNAYISVELFYSGEAKLKVRPKADRRAYSQKPPTGSNGRLISDECTNNSDGLTREAQSKIKRASRCYQRLIEDDKGYPGMSSFITLTYGEQWPSDRQAKRDLDNFLKRLRYRKLIVHYVWVAERQKRGAIHFHILTPNYIDKEVINVHWNEVVNKRQRKQNGKVQKLYPNVIGVYDAGKYASKYMQKEGESIVGYLWNMSTATHELCRPVDLKEVECGSNEINEVIESIEDVLSRQTIVFGWVDYMRNRGLWTADGKALIDELSTRRGKLYENST